MENIMKRARSRMKLRQTDMAEIMGVTQATVSRWESDIGEPNLSEWQRLVAAAKLRRIRIESVLEQAQ